MSVVTAVRYLAEFAAEALRPWEPSRELAAKLLADLPLMVRLRRDDAATADEVTHLVLGRFLPAEPPSVPGVDWLPGAVITSEMARAIERARAANPGGLLTAAVVNAAKASLVEVQPDAEQVPCCEDHSATFCGVMEDGYDACCTECPEFRQVRRD